MQHLAELVCAGPACDLTRSEANMIGQFASESGSILMMRGEDRAICRGHG
jgi:hypothetical protein